MFILVYRSASAGKALATGLLPLNLSQHIRLSQHFRFCQFTDFGFWSANYTQGLWVREKDRNENPHRVLRPLAPCFLIYFGML
jgi:hypothetical protein